ncbi:P-loop containing nucleoside triphosphate hydrolase protein [Acephala macrosclerotiorum]|nr:P-loop containing nucleoside triphosphate hydrolase protein [Acephala macrosclerotiorum]
MPQIPTVEPEQKVLGKHALVQYFYEGPKKCDCCINWVEKEPIQVPEASKQQYENAAIHVYKAKDHKSSSTTFGGVMATRYKSIEIQSQIISDLITPVLIEIGMVLPKKGKIQFSPPFNELYFAQPKIKEIQQQYAEGTDESAHLEKLMELMDKLFSETSSEVKDLREKRMISCPLIWTIFPKGILVYSRVRGHDRIYQVIDTSSDILTTVDKKEVLVARWEITCRYVIFDGTRFGMATTTLKIPAFKGVKNISSLPVYPLGYHSDATLEQKLLERGERMLAFQDMSHWEYEGVGLNCVDAVPDYEPEERTARKGFHVGGRVVIDPFSYFKYNPDEFIEVDPLELQVVLSSEMQRKRDLEQAEAMELVDIRPSLETQALNRARVRERRQFLLLMTPMLPGYSLNLNKWLWLYVQNLKQIPATGEAFDHLVIPEDQKSLILTFVQKHHETDRSGDDVIAGKGQGLTILLSGPPGTGKTLTAESVADKLQRPLYQLCAEELGTNVSTIGRHLAKTLELAEEWNAILLLDEADTFLAKRTLRSTGRNDLVAVFLRQIEYYRGIIFLTTNLLNNIDEAFRSRIQIHLCYPPLSFEYRQKLWEKFLFRASGASGTTEQHNHGQEHLSPQDLASLAEWKLNGREIGHATTNASLWCSYNGFPLTLARLEATIKVTAPFAKRMRSSGEEDEGKSRKRSRRDLDLDSVDSEEELMDV